ncbi:hypothetical protein H1C71_007711 [Ictidomys tridecemlineatus]|nr:hypothetical protein H1C71_007711 [Ictidomys tridecemlineatus]
MFKASLSNLARPCFKIRKEQGWAWLGGRASPSVPSPSSGSGTGMDGTGWGTGDLRLSWSLVFTQSLRHQALEHGLPRDTQPPWFQSASPGQRPAGGGGRPGRRAGLQGHLTPQRSRGLPGGNPEESTDKEAAWELLPSFPEHDRHLLSSYCVPGPHPDTRNQRPACPPAVQQKDQPLITARYAATLRHHAVVPASWVCSESSPVPPTVRRPACHRS